MVRSRGWCQQPLGISHDPTTQPLPKRPLRSTPLRQEVAKLKAELEALRPAPKWTPTQAAVWRALETPGMTAGEVREAVRRMGIAMSVGGPHEALKALERGGLADWWDSRPQRWKRVPGADVSAIEAVAVPKAAPPPQAAPKPALASKFPSGPISFEQVLRESGMTWEDVFSPDELSRIRR